MLLLAALAVGVPAGPAQAAVVRISLTVQGPTPNPANVNVGDTVVFANDDRVDHTVKATSGWTFSKVISAGQQASHVFQKAGTYGYTDQHAVLIQDRIDNAAVVVKGSAASPSPTARPTTSPKPQPKPSPKPSATPATTPTPTATPATGTATRPGLGAGVLPTATPTPTGVPQPDIAPQVPVTPVPGPSAAAVRYSSRGLVQDSAHRYGLPSALAVVALTGVASLLVRVLLAHPAARRRADKL